MYHVINRGDQRQDIFKNDVDRQRLLITASEVSLKTDWQIRLRAAQPGSRPAA
jgi:hypothetical protein